MYLNRFWFGYNRILKEFPGFFIRPTFRHWVLAFIQVFNHFFNATVLVNQVLGLFWANTFDCVAIVAAEQYAQINELLKSNNSQASFTSLLVLGNLHARVPYLIHCIAKTLKYLVHVELLDWHFFGLTVGHVPQKNIGAKSQRVHVFCGCCVDLAAFNKGSTLGLCFTRSLFSDAEN